MSLHRVFRAAVCASLSLPLFFAAGCSDDGTVGSTTGTNLAKGNWQISSSAVAAVRLPALSGELTPQANSVTGILHSQSASSCVTPGAAFAVSGSVDSNSVLTLTGSVAGGTLTLTGTLASDGKSLSDPTYNVTGGTCAFAQKVQAVAQAFSPMQGNYAGNFADADGNIAQVTANLSQSSTPDANGNFTLAGTATVVSANSSTCFPSSLTVNNTQVTGNTFTYQLTPANTNSNNNTVTASGTFSADGSTLTVTNWTLSGTCGSDTGVQSTMTRQGG